VEEPQSGSKSGEACQRGFSQAVSSEEGERSGPTCGEESKRQDKRCPDAEQPIPGILVSAHSGWFLA
jgi:hypothetical protein